MNVSEYLADFFGKLGVEELFSVSGGGAMYLNDALGFHPKFRFIATHHEQAAAMAAEGHARITGKIGLLHVTSGPGGTNAITGVYGAWIDSIPLFVVSGQASTDRLISGSLLRQLGVQEVDILSAVRHITKYAVMVTEPRMIRYHLEKALHYAMSGRPGPVWLDIPIDVQGAKIDPDDLPGYTPETPPHRRSDAYLDRQVAQCLTMIGAAERPVIVPGYGVRLAGGVESLRRLIDKLQIPVVSSWNASDMFASDDPLYVGRCGFFGSRAGNFAVQNADLLLVVGCRLSITMTGHNTALFARDAKQVIVDIDESELVKPTVRPDLPIVADAKAFVDRLLTQMGNFRRHGEVDKWLGKCRDWKHRYPVVLDEYRKLPTQVNSYYFTEQLSERLPSGSVVVTDMGTSFTCTMQTFATKEGQRLFTSSGLAAMGFGLPGAIGACFANGRRRTICITGDGGLMFNLQELQTIVQYKLPIAIFVLSNNGYLTMKITQRNHFKRLVGSDPSSGVSCPDFVNVAKAFGIDGIHVRSNAELLAGLDQVLAAPGAFLCEIEMPETQPLIPRVQTMKSPEGKLMPTPIEDMFPFLEREELRRNMVIPTVTVRP
jgi:acetolactate synthase-1/2/3 large subunit